MIKLCREINKLRRCMCVEGLLLTYITICDFTCSFICRNEVVFGISFWHGSDHTLPHCSSIGGVCYMYMHTSLFSFFYRITV